MMRALFSAISGMKNHMSYMDVVGNNIANVNTIAFKSSRATFQDILGQTVRGASTPQAGRGGTNPAQIGLGMQLGGNYGGTTTSQTPYQTPSVWSQIGGAALGLGGLFG